jgi:membrane protease YdiL (CAAX protease family)
VSQSPSTEETQKLIEQNPLIALAVFGLLLLFSFLIVGCLVTWLFLLKRIANGKPLLLIEAWTPRIWGFLDLVVIALLVLVFQFQSVRIGCSVLGIDGSTIGEGKAMPIALAAALSLGNLLAMLASMSWIVLRYHNALAASGVVNVLVQMGFSLQRLSKNLAIGFVATLACLPLVYGMLYLVNLGFDTTYNHPLLDEMKRDGTLFAYFLTGLSAVVIAPLVEEFLFRVMIQGWLQSVPFGSLKSIFIGGPVEVSHQAACLAPREDLATRRVSEDLVTRRVSEDLRPGHSVNPYEVTVDAGIGVVGKAYPPLWPAFLTGILFGLAHLGYGYSFIPLMVLGTVLGLLYRATQTIWPSLVVHILLNGTSIYALGVSILVG